MKPTALVVLRILLDGAWHTDYDLIEKAGQTQAGRRLRELRAMRDADKRPVYPIERRRRIGPDGKALATCEYRLINPIPTLLTNPPYAPGSHTMAPPRHSTGPPAQVSVSGGLSVPGATGEVQGAGPGHITPPRQAPLPLTVHPKPSTEYGPP